MRRCNAPEGTDRASDSGIAKLLGFIECGDKHCSRASLECGTRHRHSTKAVRVGLQHHIEVTTGRKLRLECANIRRNGIKADLNPGITPECR